VTLVLDRPAEGALDLDTRGLAIESVTGKDGARLSYELAAPDPQRLAAVASLRRRSHHHPLRTATDAVALQWLTLRRPRAAASLRLHAVPSDHARTIVPCQDSPRVALALQGAPRHPSGLRAVMRPDTPHAPRKRSRARDRDLRDAATIPSYLLAFAGGTSPGATSAGSRVYAEPELLDAAAWSWSRSIACSPPRRSVRSLWMGSIRSLDHAAVLPYGGMRIRGSPSSRRPCSPAIDRW